MKALTLYPEWAFAVAHLGKRVENRTWCPPPGLLRVGDQLAIHGGAAFGGTSTRIGVGGKVPSAWLDAVRDMVTMARRAGAPMPERITMRRLIEAAQGKIVAVARFGGTPTSVNDPWFVGPVGWLLEDVQVLRQPVACKGAQGLWDLPPAVLAQVADQLGPATPKVRL